MINFLRRYSKRREAGRELDLAYLSLEPFGYDPRGTYPSDHHEVEAMNVEEILSFLAGLVPRNPDLLRRNLPLTLALLSEVEKSASQKGLEEACVKVSRHLHEVEKLMDLG